MMYYLITLFSGLPLAFQCTVNVLNQPRVYIQDKKIDNKHVCDLFPGYLPLGIIPPTFNMGSMLTGRAANLAFFAPTGQFLMGADLFTWTN